MIRYIWIAVMATLAVLAAGLQLDRQARRQPELAPLVPAPFRSFALERQTISTVRADTPVKALQNARLLVERRPVPSEHLSLLAIAEVRNGNEAGAALIVQQAARRGWRDSIAQQAMFDIALNAGDMAEASRRVAALWAMREDQVPVADFTARLLATPQGRSAMAQTLTTGGRWERAFLAGGIELPPATFAATINEAAARGARLDCLMLDRLKSAYVSKHLENEAAIIEKGRLTCQR